MPRFASCQAASLPARPAPTTVACSSLIGVLRVLLLHFHAAAAGLVGAQVPQLALAAALFVAIPLLLELPQVLRIWLGAPPPFMVGLAACAVFEYLLLVSTSGYDTAVYARGRLALYQCVVGSLLISTLPVMGLVHWMGGGVHAVAASALAMVGLFCLARLAVASRLVGMRVRDWLRGLALPVGFVSLAAAAIGALPRLLLADGWQRVTVTAAVSAASFAALLWRFALDDAERDIVRAKVLSRVGRRQ